MKHTLLIGENNALFIENNQLFNKKIIPFSELKNMGISDVRIISNRSDVEFGMGYMPDSHPWQRKLVRESYIIGNSFDGGFFNTNPHKLSLEHGRYKTQNIKMIPDEVTSDLIKLYENSKVSGIEALALVLPIELDARGYWLFIGENSLGGFSIYGGQNDFVLFARMVDDPSPDAISQTLIYFERFGYSDGDPLQKFSVQRNPLEEFKTLHNGFSDEYLLARIFELKKPLLPTIGPDKWQMKSVREVRTKCAISILAIVAFLLLIVNIFNYNCYRDAERILLSFSPQIRIISRNADDALSRVRNDLKQEVSAIAALDEEFRRVQNDIDYAIGYDALDADTVTQGSSPKNATHQDLFLSDDSPVRLIKRIRHLFPEGMMMHGYEYNSSCANGKQHFVLRLRVEGEDAVVAEFLNNIRHYIPVIKNVSVSGKNAQKIVTIQDS